MEGQRSVSPKPSATSGKQARIDRLPDSLQAPIAASSVSGPPSPPIGQVFRLKIDKKRLRQTDT